MSATQSPPQRLAPVPLPANITSIQPGGGICYRSELAWGCWRRWWLKRFRRAYVAKMAQLRQGDCQGAPHEILDPRDLKYCCNLVECYWRREDDPFGWRERLPFARWGLAELQLLGWPLLGLTVVLVWLFWPLAILSGAALAIVVYFFRDPPRRIPGEPGVWVSPADGKVVEISHLDHDPYIGGPAVRVGIFLSIFSVHLNRSPTDARVIELRYQPGEFLNAMRPESAARNENMWIAMEEDAPPYRRFVVRQISGAVARRIVCTLRPGQTVTRGEKIGMIKLGSRTEMILPRTEQLQLELAVGQRVKAGQSIVARWHRHAGASGVGPSVPAGG